MQSNSPLALDNQLCFALYSTSLAMTQLYKDLLAPLELTYPQYTIMLILWENDGVALKAIADRLGQKSGSLTPVIKRMEAEKLITRVRGREDDRSLSIELTKKGIDLKEQAMLINQCVAQACGISDDELSEVKDKLIRLKRNISK